MGPNLKAALIAIALVMLFLLFGIASSRGAGRSLGEDIFHNTNPPCVACHNQRQGNLSYSRMPPREMAHWIRNGIDSRMPGYKLTDRQMDALIGYLMDIRR